MKRYFQTFFTQQKQNIPLLVDNKIVPEPGEFIPVSLEDYNNLKNSIMIDKEPALASAAHAASYAAHATKEKYPIGYGDGKPPTIENTEKKSERFLEIAKPNGYIIRIQGLYPKEIYDIIDKYGND